jgi:hypothetical protein
VLDRETLGLIWAGEITQWNDSRIQALNPPAVNAKLPGADITLGYSINNVLSFAEVFKVALSSFSDVFRAALASADGSFALMPPALAGRATEAGTTSANRTTWVQVHAERVCFRARMPHKANHVVCGVCVVCVCVVCGVCVVCIV